MKTREDGLKLTFEYEDAPIPRFSMLDAFGRIAELAVRHAPETVQGTAFFEAAKAVDWFSGATLANSDSLSNAPSGSKIKQLRAITLDSKPLIEHSYGLDGRRKATTYPDDVVVDYGWDDRSRSTRIWTSDGHDTQIQFRSDDCVESVIYDGDARFQNVYDSRGNIISITYPDGVRLDRSFGNDGRLTSVVCGTARIAYGWSPNGALKEYIVESGSNRACFVSSGKRFECALGPALAGAQASSWVSVNPFGLWQFGADGNLETLLAPWGERLLSIRSPEGLPLTAWGTRGMQRFDFSNGVLRATIGENGHRLYFHAVPHTDKVVLVAPDSVMLLEYDKNRRLAKLRGTDGGYCLYKWKPNGQVQQVETPLGKTKFTHDNAGRICSARLATGGECIFRFAKDGKLDTLVATGQPGSGAVLSHSVTTFCWSWLSMRGTLRLETEAL